MPSLRTRSRGARSTAGGCSRPARRSPSRIGTRSSRRSRGSRSATPRGTTERSASAWADAVDALGAVARLDVGSHAAVFAAQALGEDLGALLALMSEALRRPALAADDLEFVRGQSLAQLERDERDT